MIVINQRIWLIFDSLYFEVILIILLLISRDSFAFCYPCLNLPNRFEAFCRILLPPSFVTTSVTSIYLQ